MRRRIEGKVLPHVVGKSKENCVAGDGAMAASSTDGHFCRRAEEYTNVMRGRGMTWRMFKTAGSLFIGSIAVA